MLIMQFLSCIEEESLFQIVALYTLWTQIESTVSSGNDLGINIYDLHPKSWTQL